MISSYQNGFQIFNIYKKQKMNLKLLFFPLAILVSLVVVIWLLKPAWDDYRKNSDLTAQAEKRLAEVSGKEGNLKKALEVYNNLGSDFTLVENAIPEKNENGMILAEIFEKAKKTGVIILEVSFSESKKEKLLPLNFQSSSTDQSISMTIDQQEKLLNNSMNGLANGEADSSFSKGTAKISVVGYFDQVKNFVAEVDKMNRISDVSTFKWEKIKKIDGGSSSVGGDEKVSTEGVNKKENQLKMDVEFGYYLKRNRTISNASVATFDADPLIKAMLSGNISKKVIEDFKAVTTSSPFSFDFSSETGGKANIFQ